MALTPTTPIDPAQRIDAVYGPDGLVEELVWTHPIDGTAVRRRDGQPDEQVTGLPIPEAPALTADEKLAAAAAVLAEATALEAPVLSADVQDILARAAEALGA